MTPLRKMENTAELAAVTGWKLRFTVTITLSMVSKGVTATSSPSAVHTVAASVAATLVLVLSASASGSTTVDNWLMSRSYSHTEKDPSAVSSFAARTEYVKVPVAPGESRYVMVTGRFLSATPEVIFCSRKFVSMRALLRNRVNLVVDGASESMVAVRQTSTFEVAVVRVAVVSMLRVVYVVVVRGSEVKDDARLDGYKLFGNTTAAICLVWLRWLRTPFPIAFTEYVYVPAVPGASM